MNILKESMAIQKLP